MIYLDNNATTQVSPEVLKKMEPYFCHLFGNPSSLHKLGYQAHEEVEKVREKIARKIGAEADEIIFTSSGSEANNLALKGYAYAHRHLGQHIITSSIEHASILKTAHFLEEEGFQVTYLDVDKNGFVLPEQLKKAIRPDTILISIAHVNNEIGTVQPLRELVNISRPIPFHTDAVQSFLKTDFNVNDLGIDMASFSGHKFHAPKGVGFLFKRKSIHLTPLIHGGQQEMKLRSGTENVPYIIGLGESLDSMSSQDVESMRGLQRYLIQELKAIPGIHLNGPEELDKRICNNVNFSYDAVEGDILLNELSLEGYCVSTGSACQSRHSRVSHVLKAINCPPIYIHGNLRIGLSKYTTQRDLEGFILKLKEIIQKDSPFKLYR